MVGREFFNNLWKGFRVETLNVKKNNNLKTFVSFKNNLKISLKYL
jgi:hypothetical protein